MKEMATDCSIYRDRELLYVLRASVKHFIIATYGIFSELNFTLSFLVPENFFATGMELATVM